MKEIQILRAIATIAVVTVHTAFYFTQIKTVNFLQIISLYIDYLASFANETFLFISGFVLAAKYYEDFDLKNFYLKRSLSILPQYVIFSIGYMLYNDLPNIVHGNISISFSSVISNLIFGSASYHLWFLPVLFQLYILYPLIIKLYKNYQAKFLIASFFITVLWNFSMLLINIFNKPLMDNFANQRLFISVLFWFVLGTYVSRNYSSVKNTITKINPVYIFIVILLINVSMIGNVVGGLAQGYNYYQIPQSFKLNTIFLEPLYNTIEIAFYLIIAIKLQNMKSKLSNAFSMIARYSYGITLFHVLIIDIIVTRVFFYLNISWNDYIFFPALFAGTLAVCYLLTQLIQLLPFSFWVVGIKNKPVKRPQHQGYSQSKVFQNQ